MNEKQKKAMQDALLIRAWNNEKLISELRNPVRATLTSEKGYTIVLAEAMARILERHL